MLDENPDGMTHNDDAAIRNLPHQNKPSIGCERLRTRLVVETGRALMDGAAERLPLPPAHCRPKAGRACQRRFIAQNSSRWKKRIRLQWACVTRPLKPTPCTTG